MICPNLLHPALSDLGSNSIADSGCPACAGKCATMPLPSWSSSCTQNCGKKSPGISGINWFWNTTASLNVRRCLRFFNPADICRLYFKPRRNQNRHGLRNWNFLPTRIYSMWRFGIWLWDETWQTDILETAAVATEGSFLSSCDRILIVSNGKRAWRSNSCCRCLNWINALLFCSGQSQLKLPLWDQYILIRRDHHHQLRNWKESLVSSRNSTHDAKVCTSREFPANCRCKNMQNACFVIKKDTYQ